MQNFNDSEIIVEHTRVSRPNGLHYDALTLKNGYSLLINAHEMALYKSLRHALDPLSDGFLSACSFDHPLTSNQAEISVIENFTAGFVGLVDGKTLLILPGKIILFPNKESALFNQNAISTLFFE